MPYLLAAVALAAPIVLVVQAIRGRVQVRSCCAVPADQDRRLADPEASTTAQTGVSGPLDRV
jgi:hypothetical protein